MTQRAITRYRGFNLLDLFSTSNRWDEHFSMTHGDFVEDDFRWMQEWGFNFVRIPMSYLYFIGDTERRTFLESKLEHLDRLIALGEKYGIHISLNFHRGAGYCVTSYPFDTQEPGNLWNREEDLDLFCTHWEIFAKRFKGVSSERLSFDLLNEPPFLIDSPSPLMLFPLDSIDIETSTMATNSERYLRVHKTAVERIHAIDPGRMVIIEGSAYGHSPSWELKDMPNTMQSMRGYLPIYLSHHGCPRPPSSMWVKNPTWPFTGTIAGQEATWNKELLHEMLSPWFKFAEAGYTVHMGECGCYKDAPHDAVLAWFEDMLTMLKEHNIGYSLWNFRGTFGILDSEREDVEYEDWHGHKLDRKLLTLLQKY